MAQPQLRRFRRAVVHRELTHNCCVSAHDRPGFRDYSLQTAIQFVDYVLEKLFFVVQVIQTDNGSEFGSSFHYHVLDKGVGHRYINPRTPRLNGKVERSHRIDAEEFYRLLDGAVIDDAKVFNNKLQEREDYYNYHRPHGGLDGQAPYERLKQKTKARV